MIDRTKTLTEIEGDDWGRPPYGSYVVTTCHSLRKKPLNELSDEEIRLAIGQQMSLQYLVPIALERLAENPLAGGDLYEGALYSAVLRTDPAYWQEKPQQWEKANELGEIVVGAVGDRKLRREHQEFVIARPTSQG